MGLVVPKARKHLCADALFDSVRTTFADIADHRQGDPDIRVYGIERVPCDTSMREILDPLKPEVLRAALRQMFRHLQRGKALEDIRAVP